MKKKNIILIVLLVVIISIIVCVNNSVKKEKHEIICTKKGVKQTNKVDNTTYIKDLTFYVKLDNKKLLKYSNTINYKYKTKKLCQEKCDVTTKLNKDINNRNYSGFKKTTDCNCRKKMYKETSEYDIVNLDKKLRNDVSYLKEDNSFDLDRWKKKYESNGYECK